MELEAFELVLLLRRPDDATDYPDEEIDRIQREQLAFYAGLQRATRRCGRGGSLGG